MADALLTLVSEQRVAFGKTIVGLSFQDAWQFARDHALQVSRSTTANCPQKILFMHYVKAQLALEALHESAREANLVAAPQAVLGSYTLHGPKVLNASVSTLPLLPEDRPRQQAPAVAPTAPTSKRPRVVAVDALVPALSQFAAPSLGTSPATTRISACVSSTEARPGQLPLFTRGVLALQEYMLILFWWPRTTLVLSTFAVALLVFIGLYLFTRPRVAARLVFLAIKAVIKFLLANCQDLFAETDSFVNDYLFGSGPAPAQLSGTVTDAMLVRSQALTRLSRNISAAAVSVSEAVSRLSDTSRSYGSETADPVLAPQQHDVPADPRDLLRIVDSLQAADATAAASMEGLAEASAMSAASDTQTNSHPTISMYLGMVGAVFVATKAAAFIQIAGH